MAPDLNTLPSSSHSARPSMASAPPTPPKKQPNILYIMADQLAAPLLKMYNPESLIKTPHLDALAAESVVFDSAYCPSPLCAPSRMSMITGQLPTKIGAYDNACSISSDIPTYAHYLRNLNYETVLAGKMHFVGEQLHGYESRLTSDIYPGDFGWAVNWDQPDRRLEWYHNASSILQAGPCVRSNQLDYDEEVMYRSTQWLYDRARQADDARPFCLTVSLTHPHDPYTIEEKYWDLYEDVDIPLPTVSALDESKQDPHSKRLLHVCDLADNPFTNEQILRARRAYYGAVSYVDDCIGRLLETLRKCRLDEDTIIMFSGDHGDMLGERGLWYKMSYFEASVRVPFLILDPRNKDGGRHVKAHVSTLDVLPTMVELVGGKLLPDLEIDGVSLADFLRSEKECEDLDENWARTVYAEYCGEGTIAPLMMIRSGPWKFITAPTSDDPDQLFNLDDDPLELLNLANLTKEQEAEVDATPSRRESVWGPVREIHEVFRTSTLETWDFAAIDKLCRENQRRRRFVWSALKKGRWTSWDWDPVDDGREKYIRSHLPLDELELRARYPAVDMLGKETRPDTRSKNTLTLLPVLKKVKTAKRGFEEVEPSQGNIFPL